MKVICEGDYWSCRRERDRMGGKTFMLNLYLHEPDTLRCHTEFTLAHLYGGEWNLAGGRFQRYRPDLRENSITFDIPVTDHSDARFDLIVEWIAEKLCSSWSFSFDVTPVVVHGSPCSLVKARFYFEDVDEAMLCLLSL